MQMRKTAVLVTMERWHFAQIYCQLGIAIFCDNLSSFLQQSHLNVKRNRAHHDDFLSTSSFSYCVLLFTTSGNLKH